MLSRLKVLRYKGYSSTLFEVLIQTENILFLNQIIYNLSRIIIIYYILISQSLFKDRLMMQSCKLNICRTKGDLLGWQRGAGLRAYV